MDADLADDPVGVASARMLAAGVSASERRGALRLLGALESFAVPVSLDIAAAEFGLARVDCERWAGHLAAAGVLERDGDRVALVARERDRDGGLRLAEFLDAVTELDERRHRRQSFVVRPVLGALAVAAAVVAFVAFPRPQSGAQPTLTPGVEPAPAATTLAPPSGGTAPAPPPAGTGSTRSATTHAPPPTTTVPPTTAPTQPCTPLTIPPLPTTTSLATSVPVTGPVPGACTTP